MTKKEMLGKLAAAVEVVKGLPDDLEPVNAIIDGCDSDSVLVWRAGMGNEARAAFEKYANENGFALRSKRAGNNVHFFARHTSGIDVIIVLKNDARVSATDELDAIIVGDGR